MTDLQDQTDLQEGGGWTISTDVNFQSAEKGTVKYDLKVNGKQTTLNVNFTEIEKVDKDVLNIIIGRTLRILYGNYVRSRLLTGKLTVDEVKEWNGLTKSITLTNFLEAFEEEGLSLKSDREMTEEEKKQASEKRQRTMKRKVLLETGMFNDEQIEKLLNGEKL